MRERYIDIVKGMSIICIVLLHYLNGLFPTEFHTFVGSFMITSFYVCTGWVSAQHTSSRTIKEFIHKRFKQLGIPYLYWTGIILFFDSILWLCGYYDIFFLGKEIYKSMVLRGCGTLWFLPAMFLGGIIWQFLSKNKRVYIVLAFIITIVYGVLYSYLMDDANQVFANATIRDIVNAPLRVIRDALQAWVAIAFGYYTYLASKRIINKRGILFSLSLILLLLAYSFANYYPFNIKFAWHYMAPLLGPLGWIYFYKSIQNLSIWTYFNYWGKNSLCLMVTHYSIILVLFKIFITSVLHMPFEGWTTFAAFLISLPIQHLLVILIDKYASNTLAK